MPTTIKLKNSVTTTNAPSSLAQGEVAINITDKKVWVGNAATTPIQLLGDGGSVTFTSLTVTGVSTFSAGTVSAPSITTAGDTNTGIFFPAADTIAFTEGGVESMRIDSSGNLGIGTSSPAYKLDVNRGTSGVVAKFTGASSSYIFGGSTSSYFAGDTSANNAFGVDSTNNNAQVYTNGSERMRITSNGQVGIGTSSPTGVLSLVTPSGTANTLTMTGSGTAGSFMQYANTGGSFYVGLDNSTGTSFGAAYSGNIYHGGAYPIIFWTNAAERMRITSGGDVLIGTTTNTGSRKVNVVGSIASTFSDANDNQLLIGADATTAFVSSTYGSTGAYRPLTLNTNGSERMRIDSSGNLLVGTTSTILSGTTCFVTGSGNVPFKFSGGSLIAWNSGTSGTRTLIEFGTGATYSAKGSISTDGTTVSYNVTSDYRLKEDVVPMTGALAKVQALKPCTYKWKLDGTNGQGFIAHELQAVVPDCVVGEKDAVNEEGKPIYQGIDVSFLVATLTAALQEAHGLIKDLQARVNALESK